VGRILPADRIKRKEKVIEYLRDGVTRIDLLLSRRKRLKLKLFFIIMDMLTLLAYPIVFVYGKLRQFSRPIASTPLASVFVTA
jgi:hypothetical protein